MHFYHVNRKTMNNWQKPSIDDVFKVIDEAQKKLGDESNTPETMAKFFEVIETRRWKTNQEIIFNKNGGLVMQNKKSTLKIQSDLLNTLTTKKTEPSTQRSNVSIGVE